MKSGYLLAAMGVLLLAWVLVRLSQALAKRRTGKHGRRVKEPEPSAEDLAQRETAARERLARIAGRREEDGEAPPPAPPRDAAPVPGAEPPAEPPAPPVDEQKPDEHSRAMAAAMIAGMTAQVAREADLEERRSGQACTLRLVPQVPVRDRKSALRSWLGGRPRLPEGTAWPHHDDGTPLDFFAQIALADLPADLWDGLGPREGWLALFLHPTELSPLWLHVANLGPAMTSPAAPDAERHWPSPWNISRFGELMDFAWPGSPEWPVDLVPVRPDDGKSDEPAQELAGKLYKEGFDIADPALHPFDWPSLLAMLELAERKLASWYGTRPPSPNRLEQQLEAQTARLAEAESADEPPPNLARLKHSVEKTLPALIAASDSAQALGEATLAALRETGARVRAEAFSRPFDPAEAAAIVEQLQALRWQKVSTHPDPEGPDGSERVESRELSLTVHDRDAPSWVWEYLAVHFDHARHACCASAKRLPPATTAFYEPLWRDMARETPVGMGNIPFHFVHDFDPERDVTLIDLPSHTLMGWIFGDVDNLVTTMTREDLAAGRFDAVKMQVSN